MYFLKNAREKPGISRIGRGTRIRNELDKLYLTVNDFKNAPKIFAGNNLAKANTNVLYAYNPPDKSGGN